MQQIGVVWTKHVLNGTASLLDTQQLLHIQQHLDISKCRTQIMSINTLVLPTGRWFSQQDAGSPNRTPCG
jgi:hypothetical protein